MKQYLLFLFFIIAVNDIASAQEPLLPASTGITDLQAYRVGNKQIIEWKNNDTITDGYWLVEGSDNGSFFSSMGLVLGPDPRQQADNYSFIQPVNNRYVKKYYRVSQFDGKGLRSSTTIENKYGH